MGTLMSLLKLHVALLILQNVNLEQLLKVMSLCSYCRIQILSICDKLSSINNSLEVFYKMNLSFINAQLNWPEKKAQVK